MKREKDEKLNPKIQNLKRNMTKIGTDQHRIREAQRNVRHKQECNQLREQTNIIIKKTTTTKIQLALMFQILRAREVEDFSKAANLTHFLRFVF